MQAAEEIEEAYRLVTKPLETALSNPDGIGRELHYLHSGGDGEDYGSRLNRVYHAYNDWVDYLNAARFSQIYGIVIDIVVEGRRLGETEKRFCLGSGQAKLGLLVGLGAYCKVNGRVM